MKPFRFNEGDLVQLHPLLTLDELLGDDEQYQRIVREEFDHAQRRRVVFIVERRVEGYEADFEGEDGEEEAAEHMYQINVQEGFFNDPHLPERLTMNPLELPVNWFLESWLIPNKVNEVVLEVEQ